MVDLRERLDRPFNLVRWFVITGFLCIVLTAVVLSIVLSRFLEKTVVEQDAQVAMQLVNTFVRTSEAGTYFWDQSDQVFDLSSPQLQRFIDNLSNLPDIVRVNVYVPDRTLIWSSEKKLMGKRYPENDHLDMAFAGKISAMIEKVSPDDKAEHAGFPESGLLVMENYLSIWNEDRTMVVAVVETYRVPLALFGAINRGRQLIWVSVAAGGLILFLALFSLIKRANGLIGRQQEKLVEVEKFAIIGEMTSAIAHGLRNPLAAIRSSAELALYDDVPANTREALGEIVTQSDRLEMWIRQFLSGLRQPESGNTAVRLETIIEDCLSAFQAQLNGRSIETHIDTAPDLPLVTGDPTGLRQAVSSVIANSVEAMPNGGALDISATPDKDNCFVEAVFRDTGSGMNDAAAQSLKPFMTTKPAGLGIGLPLTRRILQRCGGDIHLASEESAGTTVTIRLPVWA